MGTLFSPLRATSCNAVLGGPGTHGLFMAVLYHKQMIGLLSPLTGFQSGQRFRYAYTVSTHGPTSNVTGELIRTGGISHWAVLGLDGDCKEIAG